MNKVISIQLDGFHNVKPVRQLHTFDIRAKFPRAALAEQARKAVCANIQRAVPRNANAPDNRIRYADSLPKPTALLFRHSLAQQLSHFFVRTCLIQAHENSQLFYRRPFEPRLQISR